MEIGDGVFLGAVFIGLVFLYNGTKDRWNWKKVILWPLGVLTVIALLSFAALYAEAWWDARPKQTKAFWGIALGASASDVKFAKGDPPFVSEQGEWWWYPERDHGGYRVGFADGAVRFVLFQGDPFYAPHIDGVPRDGGTADLVKRFGSEYETSTSGDQLRRLYHFKKYNVAVGYEKDRIYTLGIYDATYGPLSFAD
jgi:hypothetical protein